MGTDNTSSLILFTSLTDQDEGMLVEKYVQYIYTIWVPPVNSLAMQSFQELVLDPPSPQLLAFGITSAHRPSPVGGTQSPSLTDMHASSPFPAHGGSPSNWSKTLSLLQ